jgi:hypothetical protein
MERPEPYPEPRYERKIFGRIILVALAVLVVIWLIALARGERSRTVKPVDRDLGGADQKEAATRERRQQLLDTVPADTMIIVP